MFYMWWNRYYFDLGTDQGIGSNPQVNLEILIQDSFW